jgi:hypothetical protein
MKRVNHLIVHQGALGDWLLAMRLCESLEGAVGFATTVARARAFERCYPGRVAFLDSEHPGFRRLYVDSEPADESFGHWAGQVDGVVVGFAGSAESSSGSAWLNNARMVFPKAACALIEPINTTQTREHLTAWHARRLRELAAGVVKKTARFEPIWKAGVNGVIVIHPGSGGRAKRWPVSRFEALSQALKERGHQVRWIVGEDDLHMDGQGELRAAMARWRAEVISSLDGLVDAGLGASLWIGNDSGPSHLMGMLGVPLLVLFGPTDPVVWSPVGPRVRVIAAADGLPRAMEWLGVERVVEEASSVLEA